MIETYRHLVSLPSAHTGYRTFLTGLALPDGSTVVHCTAGKDRSGWAIALAQHVCGVGWDDILEDYLLSNSAMAQEYGPMLDQFGEQGGDAESLSHMIYVRPEYLEAAVTLVEHVFGGIDGYLAAAVGMDAAAIRGIRTALAP
jgi:protein-tyrosine phosphatase